MHHHYMLLLLNPRPLLGNRRRLHPSAFPQGGRPSSRGPATASVARPTPPPLISSVAGAVIYLISPPRWTPTPRPATLASPARTAPLLNSRIVATPSTRSPVTVPWPFSDL